MIYSGLYLLAWDLYRAFCVRFWHFNQAVYTSEILTTALHALQYFHLQRRLEPCHRTPHQSQRLVLDARERNICRNRTFERYATPVQLHSKARKQFQVKTL